MLDCGVPGGAITDSSVCALCSPFAPPAPLVHPLKRFCSLLRTKMAILKPEFGVHIIPGIYVCVHTHTNQTSGRIWKSCPMHNDSMCRKPTGELYY